MVPKQLLHAPTTHPKAKYEWNSFTANVEGYVGICVGTTLERCIEVCGVQTFTLTKTFTTGDEDVWRCSSLAFAAQLHDSHDSKQQRICNSEFYHHEFCQGTKENRWKIASAYSCRLTVFHRISSFFILVNFSGFAYDEGFFAPAARHHFATVTWTTTFTKSSNMDQWSCHKIGASLSFHIRNCVEYACAYISLCKQCKYIYIYFYTHILTPT